MSEAGEQHAEDEGEGNVDEVLVDEQWPRAETTVVRTRRLGTDLLEIRWPGRTTRAFLVSALAVPVEQIGTALRR